MKLNDLLKDQLAKKSMANPTIGAGPSARSAPETADAPPEKDDPNTRFLFRRDKTSRKSVSASSKSSGMPEEPHRATTPPSPFAPLSASRGLAPAQPVATPADARVEVQPAKPAEPANPGKPIAASPSATVTAIPRATTTTKPSRSAETALVDAIMAALPGETTSVPSRQAERSRGMKFPRTAMSPRKGEASTPVVPPTAVESPAPTKPPQPAAHPHTPGTAPKSEPRHANGNGSSGGVFDEQPVGIYEAARQLGIEIPVSQEKRLKSARTSLSLVFSQLVSHKADPGMAWPIILSIASDLDSITGLDSNLVTNLNRYRVPEEWLLWHSLYTAILGMALARHVPGMEDACLTIGGAGLLHDVGFLLHEHSIDELRGENTPALKEHVPDGVTLCREAGLADDVLTMIEQHHERLDGKGFPTGLRGDRFERTSQVLAIANLFEHSILDISAGSDVSPGVEKGDILKLFHAYRLGFETDLLKQMIALIGFYPVGSMVALSNHSICEVIRQNDGMPLRPVLKVIMDGTGVHPDHVKIIDLKQLKILSITRAVARSRTAES